MTAQSPNGRQIVAIVTIAVVAGCLPALQPILLGGLLAEHRISAAAVGYAATADAAGVALATALASAWLPPRRLRLITLAAISAVLIANALTIGGSSNTIVAAGGLSGLGNGVMLWLLVSILARSSTPTRLAAVYVTSNTSLVFVLSLVLTEFALPRFGIIAGYGILAVGYAMLVPVVPQVPDELEPLASSVAEARLPLLGIAGLCAVVLHLAGAMAFWVYSIQLGSPAGIPAASLRMMIAAATGMQIVAGLAAIALATRFGGTQAVFATVALSLMAVVTTMGGARVAVWSPAMILIAACWIFGPSFHISLLITADPTRRSAMFAGTAQLGGLAWARFWHRPSSLLRIMDPPAGPVQPASSASSPSSLPSMPERERRRYRGRRPLRESESSGTHVRTRPILPTAAMPTRDARTTAVTFQNLLRVRPVPQLPAGDVRQSPGGPLCSEHIAEVEAYGPVAYGHPSREPNMNSTDYGAVIVCMPPESSCDKTPDRPTSGADRSLEFALANSLFSKRWVA